MAKEKDIKACFSSKTDNWRTPKKIYDFFMNHDFVDIFPYQCTYSELDREYKNKKLFINPPFSKLNDYCDWIIKQIKQNEVVVLLIPSRTDTKYFHKLLKLYPTIYFFSHRLKYNDVGCAPFPSLLLIFIKNSTLPIYLY